VIVPAEKLPDASRTTMSFAILELEIAANFALVIVAFVISALTINELDNNPDALLCTTPAALNGVMVALLLITSSVMLINPAAKLPVPSRLTTAFGVSRFVALFASTVAAATFAAVCPPTKLTTVAFCVPVTSPLNEPVKLAELAAVVAVVAFPDKFAVIVPAEKLPDASRTTISFAILELEIAANFALLIVPFVMSLFTINELDNNPDALLCTTPAVVNGVIVAVLLITVSVILIKPAAKLPFASRLTMVFAVSRFVALFASAVAAAILAADWPPTKLTTVAL
jgi:hypothetical protein